MYHKCLLFIKTVFTFKALLCYCHPFDTSTLLSCFGRITYSRFTMYQKQGLRCLVTTQSLGQFSTMTTSHFVLPHTDW